MIVAQIQIANTSDAVYTVLKLHYLLQCHQRALAAVPWLFVLKYSQWLLACTAQPFLVAGPLLLLIMHIKCLSSNAITCPWGWPAEL